MSQTLRSWSQAMVAAGCALSAACSMPGPHAPSLRGSVGLPHSGFLTDAHELAQQGTGFRTRNRFDHHWGLPRLVELIEDAAGEVARAKPGSAPLIIGELSAQGGGSLMPKHRSHRSGRDADLLLFATTLEGVPVPNGEFVKIGPDGLGINSMGHFIRFDVAREWLLIRALCSSKRADVQWIFVSRVLEAMMVEHALALREPSTIIAKAEQLMQQPGDSLPHDDHLHIRVACAPGENVQGCSGGPRWPWTPSPAKPTRASSPELVDALLGPLIRHDSDDVASRAAASTTP